MVMRIKEVADLVGISVRTLHHYDEIGLLTPEETTEAGYRLYSEDNLEMLQQILFFKALDFSLKRIKDIVTSPSFNQQQALETHREMLLEKRDRLDQMLATIDKTIKHTKGELKMSGEEMFEGFDFTNNPYEKEARERWGDKAVDQSKDKLNSLSKGEQEQLSERMNAIYYKLAALREYSPASIQAQAAIKEWYDFLNNNFGYTYSLSAFKGLGQMYVEDERFTKNIDQFGQGLAKFMFEAMSIYADNNR